MLQIWVNMFYKLGQLRFITNLGKSVITKLGLVLYQIMTGITNYDRYYKLALREKCPDT